MSFSSEAKAELCQQRPDKKCCALAESYGVPDPYRMQRVKVFLVLKPGVPADEDTRRQIMEYASKHIAKYAMPKEIEFRDDLPKTLVGKVAYRVLEEEEAAKAAAAAAEADEKETVEAK